MCRNHRGFVEALVAANRIGADALLLNTSFAGPALAEVVQREGVDTVIYDEEFTADHRRGTGRDRRGDAHPRLDRRATRRSWTLTVEGLADAHAGDRPSSSSRRSTVVLLTSGTTGIPKGAKATSGGVEPVS